MTASIVFVTLAHTRLLSGRGRFDVGLAGSASDCPDTSERATSSGVRTNGGTV